MTDANPDANDIQAFEGYVTSEYGDQGGFTEGDSACTGTQIATIDFHGAPVEIYKN